MATKIKAAVDARIDADLLIVARTDATRSRVLTPRWTVPMRFEAGADMVRRGADHGGADDCNRPSALAAARQHCDRRQDARAFPTTELREPGFAGVLYANTALQAAVLGMQRALSHLKQRGQIGRATDLLATFAERQRLVGFADFQELERKYK